MTLRTLFVDFDAYFASVEQQEQPALRGRPIAVLPVLADTTCCIAASYEAKRYGIKTGTPVREARQRCPEIQFVLARHELYVRYHRRAIEAIDACVPVAAVCSIDEMACRLTPRWQQPAAACALARDIKHSVAASLGAQVRCSIGIAPNAFLAKTAADMDKPDGLRLIQQADLPQVLYGLALRDLCGIGPRMERRLHRHGITSVAQLCAADATLLHRVWGGIEGERFHRRLHGDEVTTPSPSPTPASVSHSHVLPPAQRQPAAACAVLHRLLQKAAMRLRAQGHCAGALSLSLRYLDGGEWHAQARFAETQDTFELTHAMQALWARRSRELAQLLRVGLVLFRLIERDQHTPSLFAVRPAERTKLLATIDRLNLRYGKQAVYFGGAHQALDSAPMRIAFNRIPDPDLER